MKREANGKTYLHLSDFGGAANLIPKKINVCANQSPYIDPKYQAPDILNYMAEKLNITKQMYGPSALLLMKSVHSAIPSREKQGLL